MLKLDRKAIGARIRLLRQGCGLRQWEVADRLGTTQPAVHLYEQGITPEPGRLLELARLGGTTVEWILTGRQAGGSGTGARRSAGGGDRGTGRPAFLDREGRRAIEGALDTLDAALRALRTRPANKRRGGPSRRARRQGSPAGS